MCLVLGGFSASRPLPTSHAATTAPGSASLGYAAFEVRRLGKGGRSWPLKRHVITLNVETPAPRSHLLRCCPNSVSADSKPSPSQAKWALWVWALWVLSLGPRIHVSRDTGAKPGVSVACSNGTHTKKKSAGPINNFHLLQLLKEIAGFKTN